MWLENSKIQAKLWTVDEMLSGNCGYSNIWMYTLPLMQCLHLTMMLGKSYWTWRIPINEKFSFWNDWLHSGITYSYEQVFLWINSHTPHKNNETENKNNNLILGFPLMLVLKLSLNIVRKLWFMLCLISSLIILERYFFILIILFH